MNKKIYVVFSLLFFSVNLQSSVDDNAACVFAKCAVLAHKCGASVLQTSVDLSFLNDDTYVPFESYDVLDFKMACNQNLFGVLLEMNKRMRLLESGYIDQDIRMKRQVEQYEALEEKHRQLEAEYDKLAMLFRGHKKNVLARVVDMERRLTKMYTDQIARMQSQMADLNDRILRSVTDLEQELASKVEELRKKDIELARKIVAIKLARKKVREAAERDELVRQLEQRCLHPQQRKAQRRSAARAKQSTKK